MLCPSAVGGYYRWLHNGVRGPCTCAAVQQRVGPGLKLTRFPAEAAVVLGNANASCRVLCGTAADGVHRWWARSMHIVLHASGVPLSGTRCRRVLPRWVLDWRTFACCAGACAMVCMCVLVCVRSGVVPVPCVQAAPRGCAIAGGMPNDGPTTAASNLDRIVRQGVYELYRVVKPVCAVCEYWLSAAGCESAATQWWLVAVGGLVCVASWAAGHLSAMSISFT